MVDYTTTANFAQAQIDYIHKLLSPLIAIKVEIVSLFNRLFVAFNLYQTLPDNLLLDSILTNLKENPRFYPTYKVNRISITWPTRENLLDYYNILLVHRNVGILMDLNQLDEALLIIESYRPEWNTAISESKSNGGHISGIPWLNSFTCGHIMTRLMHRSVKLLSTLALAQKRLEGNGSLKKVKFTIKKNKPSFALFMKMIDILHVLLDQKEYLQSKRGIWMDTLAKIYDLYIEDTRKAIEVCRRGVNVDLDGLSLGYRRSIQKRLDKIMSSGKSYVKWTEVILEAQKLDMGKRKGKAMYFDDATSEYVHVEQFVVRHYERKGWKAKHSENSTLSGIVRLSYSFIIISLHYSFGIFCLWTFMVFSHHRINVILVLLC